MRILTEDIIDKAGQEMELSGWVAVRRDHGKIIFIDLRDASGIVQVVFTPQCAGYDKVQEVRAEWVVRMKGMVKKRPDNMVNPQIKTGAYEIEATSLEVLSKADNAPIPTDSEGYDIDEGIRLKYRYLDLKRPRLQKNMRLRSEFIREMRSALHEHRFVEIETPTLTKATKEGSRDFLVPSRLQPGKFYALPQSPQQYKQLLMVSGFERYFQFAHALRDEDLRADRGFEHTQVDLEMSFVTQEDVMATVEAMVKKAVTAVGAKIKSDPFPVVTYDAALAQYGADKFDMRSDEEKQDGTLAFAWVTRFPFFKKVDRSDAAEVRDGKSGWTFTHNPFSTPIPEHLEWHLKGERVGEIVTAQYDLVCNGYEVGGGSIRAHDPEVLKATFRIMGYSDELIAENVGHMLEAFSYGVPPHGGIALGLDRLVMVLAGENSMREVIPFPMTSGGQTSIMDAPSLIPKEQLDEFGLEVKKQHSSK